MFCHVSGKLQQQFTAGTCTYWGAKPTLIATSKYEKPRGLRAMFSLYYIILAWQATINAKALQNFLQEKLPSR